MHLSIPLALQRIGFFDNGMLEWGVSLESVTVSTALRVMGLRSHPIRTREITIVEIASRRWNIQIITEILDTTQK